MTVSETGVMLEVRREADDELCGYVRPMGERWQALTVFHGLLADFDDSHEARRFVARQGLAALRERWSYRAAPDAEWQTVLIQEASPGRVRLAMGYYALPGIPVLDVTATDLSRGAQLELAQTLDTADRH